jgi:L-iditol 2-dehydrogenase
VRAAGICGTDLHIYHDEFPTQPPVVLGHELAGEVMGSATA